MGLLLTWAICLSRNTIEPNQEDILRSFQERNFNFDSLSACCERDGQSSAETVENVANHMKICNSMYIGPIVERYIKYASLGCHWSVFFGFEESDLQFTVCRPLEDRKANFYRI
jgi:hypothetical protein